MSIPAIRIAGVRKVYPGPVVALQDINLEVGQGEFVAVLGASGCGKSTLLRLVSGLEAPGSGEITVLGRSTDAARRDRQFGVVFQDPALFPWRTVQQNIALPLQVFHSREGAAAAVESWIERMGLRGFEKALPAQLSGGMRSRVAIARALVFRPPILLMDEPFGALDELTRSDMHQALLHLWEEYRPTVLFITHSVSEALFLADRVVVMTPRPGRIRTMETVTFSRPRDITIQHSTAFAQLSQRLLDALKG